MENETNLIAWLALGLSCIIALKDFILWLLSFRKKIAISVDYNFASDKLDGIIITSISQKPIIISSFAIYKILDDNKKKKIYTEYGNFDSFMYKKLNSYESYRIDVKDSFAIRFKPGRDYYLELYFNSSDKPNNYKIS